jgi:hypothetical protein
MLTHTWLKKVLRQKNTENVNPAEGDWIKVLAFGLYPKQVGSR